MQRSEYRIGEFLYGIPDSEESAKYNPYNQRVFIHSGYKNADGYGILIGWHDGKIKKSTGWKNFCWGADVRLATHDEIEQFMISLMNQDRLNAY